MMQKAWSNIEEVPNCSSMSSVKFQGDTAKKIVAFNPNWSFSDCNSSLNSPMAMKCCTKHETAKERCPIVFQSRPSNFKVTWDKTSPILTQIGRFRTIGRSQLSNLSDLPCYLYRNKIKFKSKVFYCHKYIYLIKYHQETLRQWRLKKLSLLVPLLEVNRFIYWNKWHAFFFSFTTIKEMLCRRFTHIELNRELLNAINHCWLLFTIRFSRCCIGGAQTYKILEVTMKKTVTVFHNGWVRTNDTCQKSCQTCWMVINVLVSNIKPSMTA